jgi:hypothetical protein
MSCGRSEACTLRQALEATGFPDALAAASAGAAAELDADSVVASF